MMKRLILLLLLAVLFVGIVQNSQPIALVFFGFKTTRALPLSVWILLFLAAGALSSSIVQFILNFTDVPTVTFNRNQSPIPPDDRDTSSYSPTNSVKEPASNANSAAIADDVPAENEDEEWQIEEPPSRRPTTEKFDPTLEKYQATVFEAQQQPQSVSRSGSIYSYTYKKSTPTKPSDSSQPAPEPTITPPPPEPEPQEQANPPANYRPERAPGPDRVYDARYRTIEPPYRDLPLEPIDRDEDEDWV